MKRALLFSAVLIFCISAYSQEDEVLSKKEQKKLQKEQRKAQKKEEEERAIALTTLMIENQRFVLEADHVGDKSGQRIPVTSTLNFVAIDSATTTLQLGSHNGIGINGVGGITVDGKVTRYEYKKLESKRGHSYNLTIYLMTSVGSYDITMFVSQSGNADATVRGNTSGQLRYYGKLVPIMMSRVYKGSAIP